MVCSQCQNPLRIIKGGQKIRDGKIIMVHVMGCMNPECSLYNKEKERIETEVPSFDE
jgi:hypothetical protein